MESVGLRSFICRKIKITWAKANKAVAYATTFSDEINVHYVVKTNLFRWLATVFEPPHWNELLPITPFLDKKDVFNITPDIVVCMVQ